MDFFYSCCHGGQVDAEPVCKPSGDTFDLRALAIDHMTSTPLFDAIQHGDWDGVNFFLQSGSFTFSPFQNDSSEKRHIAAEDQAETWVVCRNEKRKLMWRQLPIHAALCVGAPYKTVKELVMVYPDSLCCADIEGNLPLHLAVKFNSSESVLLLLLRAFPEALQAENGKGEKPLDCAKNLQDNAARARYRLFQTFIDCRQFLNRKECDQTQREIKSLSNASDIALQEIAQSKKELQVLRNPLISKIPRLGVRDRLFCRRLQDKVQNE